MISGTKTIKHNIKITQTVKLASEEYVFNKRTMEDCKQWWWNWRFSQQLYCVHL